MGPLKYRDFQFFSTFNFLVDYASSQKVAVGITPCWRISLKVGLQLLAEVGNYKTFASYRFT